MIDRGVCEYANIKESGEDDSSRKACVGSLSVREMFKFTDESNLIRLAMVYFLPGEHDSKEILNIQISKLCKWNFGKKQTSVQ